MELTLSIDPLGASATLHVDGELDLATAPELNEALADAVIGREEIVLDLGGLSFVDSAGLAVLLAHRRAARAQGTVLRVVRPQPNVLRAFELAGLCETLVAAG